MNEWIKLFIIIEIRITIENAKFARIFHTREDFGFSLYNLVMVQVEQKTSLTLKIKQKFNS